MRYATSHYLQQQAVYRCSLCGDIAPVLTWMRGNYWYGGYYACDACVRAVDREHLLTMIGCAALCLLPVVALAGWIALGFVQAFLQALR